MGNARTKDSWKVLELLAFKLVDRVVLMRI